MDLRGARVFLCLLFFFHCSFQQSCPEEGKCEKCCVNAAVIKELRKQIEDVAQEVMLLKEQQALQTVCLKGVKIHGKCFLADTQRKPFHTATEDCISKGGTLSTPVTSDENSKLCDYVRKTIRLDEHIWLGINDMVTEGQWLDQTGSPLLYNNWHTKVIQKPEGNRSQNCAVLSATSRGKWFDENCRAEKASICEFNIV